MAETRYQVPVTKYRQIVFAAKVAAVGIFAVGIEFFTTQHVIEAIVLWVVAIVLSLWPVKIDVTADEEGPSTKGGGEGGGAIHPLEEI